MNICHKNLDNDIYEQGRPNEVQKLIRQNLTKQLKDSRDNDYKLYYDELMSEVDNSMGGPDFWDKFSQTKSGGNFSNMTLKANNGTLTSDPQEIVDIIDKAWRPLF